MDDQNRQAAVGRCAGASCPPGASGWPRRPAGRTPLRRAVMISAAPLRPKRRHHCPAEEPGAAGDEHALIRDHGASWSSRQLLMLLRVSPSRVVDRAALVWPARNGGFGETHSSTRRACQVQDPIGFSWVPVAQRQPMVGFLRAPGRRDIREESARRWSASCCYRSIAAIRIASTR